MSLLLHSFIFTLNEIIDTFALYVLLLFQASSNETYTSFSRMDIDFQTSPEVNEEVVIAVSDSVSESAGNYT